jgi:hypothetical protein
LFENGVEGTMAWISLAIVGGIALTVSEIWLAVIAFRESNSCGLLTLFIPFYNVYYAITRRSQTKLVIYIGAIGLLSFVFGLGLFFTTNQSEVKPVLKEFMEAGLSKDVARAYTFCHQSVNREDVVNLINKTPEVFTGYKNTSITSLNVTYGTDGTFAEISGIMTYMHGEKKPFYALMFKEEPKVWKIVEIRFSD